MDWKTGYKTTEFWMTLAAQVGVIWTAVEGLVPGKWAAIISVSGAGLYAILRTVLKLVADLKEISKAQTTSAVK